MTMRPRLLIVEDEADAAASLELLLEPRGYQVRVAATAAPTSTSGGRAWY